MIYLDSAATTLEKPQSVPYAVAEAIRRMASPGRGGYAAGDRAEKMIYSCRELAASLFDVPSPEQVVLTSNATHGLNIAIRSLVTTGGTVLISGYEHNAVTRVLCDIPGVNVKVAAGPLFDQDGVYAKFEQMLDGSTDAVVCNHVSNVFGFVQPVERIAALCGKRGVPLIIDASQSAGSIPIKMRAWGAEFIAMPGHKGLYGPQGTGLLLCKENAKPLLCGGTGGTSLKQSMPEFLPDRLEAGTPNVCGVAGLLAGMKFVQQQGVHRIRRHECELRREMMRQLSKVNGIQLFRGEGSSQSGLFSFCVDGADCETFAEKLGKNGVAVRAGLHCAPLAHRTAGTVDFGTIRVSFSAFNTRLQVLAAADLIRRTACNMRGG